MNYSHHLSPSPSIFTLHHFFSFHHSSPYAPLVSTLGRFWDSSFISSLGSRVVGLIHFLIISHCLTFKPAIYILHYLPLIPTFPPLPPFSFKTLTLRMFYNFTSWWVSRPSSPSTFLCHKSDWPPCYITLSHFLNFVGSRVRRFKPSSSKLCDLHFAP